MIAIVTGASRGGGRGIAVELGAIGATVYGTESPRYLGRAVAALANDPNVHAKTGRVCSVGDLAVEYGFTDIDGRVIPPYEMP